MHFQGQVGCYNTLAPRSGVHFDPPLEKKRILLQIVFVVFVVMNFCGHQTRILLKFFLCPIACSYWSTYSKSCFATEMSLVSQKEAGPHGQSTMTFASTIVSSAFSLRVTLASRLGSSSIAWLCSAQQLYSPKKQ